MGNMHRFLADGGALVAALLLVLAVVLAVVLAAIFMPSAGLAQTPMGDYLVTLCG